MSNNKIEEYLKKPYARVLIPEEDGGYAAEILEFPGCHTFGETADEAMKNLDDAAYNWIEAALSQKQTIPEPQAENEPSGKVLLRLPRNLHKKAMQLAERERVSVNTFLVGAVAERVGALSLYEKLIKRLEEREVKANNAVKYYPEVAWVPYQRRFHIKETSETSSTITYSSIDQNILNEEIK